MPVCHGCSIDFYGLSGDICYKCKELAGKSDPEKVSIRSKGQCLGCSVVYGELQTALCSGCCQVYAKADSIPRQIFELPGASEQILNFQTSDLTSELWETAQGFKKTASDHRLGLPRVQNSSLKKAIATSTLKKASPGIAKGATILQEMQDKREQGKKVKFTVLLFKSVPGRKGAPALVPIPNVRPVENIHEDLDIYAALDHIVIQVQEFHAKAYPLAAKVRRQMLTFFANESVTKYFNIPEENLTEGNVSGFLAYFRSKGHISKAQFEAKQLELRLVVDEIDLYPSGYPEFTMPSAILSAAPSLRRAKARNSIAPRGPDAVERVSRPRAVIRTSAWPKPARVERYSRPSKMVECRFKRITTSVRDLSNVVHSLPGADAQIEHILVAEDWQQGVGLAKSNEDYLRTGYLGSGSAKNVIYARIGEQEYALAQASDILMSDESHLDMLSAELKNLHQGALILKEFLVYAEELEVVIPAFQFNVEGAFLGVLEPLDRSAGDVAVLDLDHFLATPLLPCGKADAAIKKFTGNTDCGQPPEDTLTMAIHAFSHWVPMYTGESLVLCDLQGMCDRKNVMTLIDPQSHSTEADEDSRQYWDLGPKGIKSFLAHHLKFEHEHTPRGRVRSLSPSKSPEQQRKKQRNVYRIGFPTP